MPLARRTEMKPNRSVTDCAGFGHEAQPLHQEVLGEVVGVERGEVAVWVAESQLVEEPVADGFGQPAAHDDGLALGDGLGRGERQGGCGVVLPDPDPTLVPAGGGAGAGQQRDLDGLGGCAERGVALDLDSDTWPGAGGEGDAADVGPARSGAGDDGVHDTGRADVADDPEGHVDGADTVVALGDGA